MDYKNDVAELTDFTSTWKPCKHKNSVLRKKGFIFKKWRYYCYDCKKWFTTKELRKTREWADKITIRK